MILRGKTMRHLAKPLHSARLSALAVLALVLCGAAHQPAEKPLSSPSLRGEQLAGLDSLVETAIREGKTPGAVVLIGNREEIIYSRAFGFRSLEPKKVPMSEDTIFDLASLTKVIATSTAVMQLAEKGKLNIDAPVAKYWPAFGENGKKRITVRQLLTHHSGLRAGLSLKPGWSGYEAAMRKIIAEKPSRPPGSGLIYSDINFEALGEVVRRVSGEPLDQYCSRHIFTPLGMKETGFKISADLRDRIAPTQYRKNRLICGEAHDPECYLMGGVAGHAGLFSSAADLSIFGRMLLAGGEYGGARILSPHTIEMMTTPQSPEVQERPWAGLGSRSALRLEQGRASPGGRIRTSWVHRNLALDRSGDGNLRDFAYQPGPSRRQRRREGAQGTGQSDSLRGPSDRSRRHRSSPKDLSFPATSKKLVTEPPARAIAPGAGRGLPRASMSSKRGDFPS